MPIDVIRFGVGHRRPHGPAGMQGIGHQVIHSDARGVVSELAFARNAIIEPHSSPNTAYFIVIEGGGWVIVGEERLRVAAGEAVVWPAGIIHGAWTEHTQMRALIVELAGADDSGLRELIEGRARALAPGEADEAARGDGWLAPHRPVDPPVDRSTGEPL